MSFQDIVHKEKDQLYKILEKDMNVYANRIIKSFASNEDFESILIDFASSNSISGKTYVLDSNKVQITSDVYADGVNDNFKIKELDKRLLKTISDNDNGFYISNTYISRTTLRPSATAVRVLTNDASVIGYFVLDIVLSSSSQTRPQALKHIQLKGDPAIRDHIFSGSRQLSAMDEKIDDVHSIAKEMLCELGVFHLKLHYSSSRATLWYFDNPYEYQVHTIKEIINPDVCFLYSDSPYPTAAKIPKKQIPLILSKLKNLRYMDDNIYLRAGSINIMNGMIGLNFSCDGSHYLPANDFIEIIEDQFGV